MLVSKHAVYENLMKHAEVKITKTQKKGVKQLQELQEHTVKMRQEV